MIQSGNDNMISKIEAMLINMISNGVLSVMAKFYSLAGL